MERVCFISRIRPQLLAEYRDRHEQVWPEMQNALRRAGWGNYSLYLADDGLLVGYLETDDYEAALRGMAQAGVNDRWQAEMQKYFATDEDLRPDEGFRRLPEIFHLD